MRRCGSLFERTAALLQHRHPVALFHSALEITIPDGRFVIEMGPVADRHDERRGVVAHGPVGTRWAGRFRPFRYELRRWRDGVIDDAGLAVDSPLTLSVDPIVAHRILVLTASVPTPVWGRDELAAGEMWNSNSVSSWLLERAGLDTTGLRAPAGGRAPGWDAGVAVARRRPDRRERAAVGSGILLRLARRFDGRAASFESRFATARTGLLARSVVPAPAPAVTEADLAPLPSLVQTYLRRVGVIGRPRVRNVRVELDAQMRSSSTSPWMPATATEYGAFGSAPTRLFHMRAARAGIPIDVLHQYDRGAATFEVRIAGLIPVVNKSGPAISHDETVTVMNDVLVLAPAALLDLPFTFQAVDERSVQATFSNAGFDVTATLAFDDAGDLVGFQSADRSHDRDDGPAIWSTPISDYDEIDGIRVGTHGDATWIDATGEWTYGRFSVRALAYNVAA